MAQSRREKKEQMRFLTFWANQKTETRILKNYLKKKRVVLSTKTAMNTGKKKRNFFSPAHRNQFSTQDALKGPTPSETII